ncbi:MAG: hypothetical protein QJR14_00895 [Bacillota bacterium]|nr:hypothetical protein [Bacillota bacterium]
MSTMHGVPSRSTQRFLGDTGSRLVHDLLRETPDCGALEVLRQGKAVGFIPDSLQAALDEKFRPCPHCLPEAAAPAGGEGERPDGAAVRGEVGAVQD